MLKRISLCLLWLPALVQAQSFEMENPGERARWEQLRLADPITGLIPPAMRARELAFSSTLPSDGHSQKADSLTVPWQQRGPWNLGGRTRAFAIDITNENVLFAGGVSGGLWRSSDAGTTWSRNTPANFHPGVNGIVQDTRPGHTDTWYLISGEAYGTSASGGDAFYLGTGMFKSTDGGTTWSPLTSTTSNTPQSFDNVWDATWNLCTNAADSVNDMVYVSTLGAVMRSTNGGTSWTRVLGSTTNSLAYFTNVMCTPQGVLYATLSSDGTSAGIWRSVDGVNWVNINPAFMPQDWGRIVSAYVPQNENVVYFLAAQTDSAGKLTFDFRGTPEWNSLWRYTYLSGDGSAAGGLWEDLSANIPASNVIFGSFNAQGGYDLTVAVKPDDSNMVFIGGTNIFRSTTAFNDSLNTTHIAGYAVNATAPTLYNDLYPNQHPDQHVIQFLPSDPNVLYSANDGGLWRTYTVGDSIVSWTDLNHGYLVSQFYTLDQKTTAGDELIIGGLQDNGTWWSNSAQPTDAWKWVAGGDGSYCAFEPLSGHYIFSKQNGKILKCAVDNTGTVTDWERIDPAGASNYKFINPFVLDPANTNRLYLPAGRKVWRLDDLSSIPFTQTYDSITTGWVTLPDTVPGVLEITAIAATDDGRLYIGTDNKSIYRIDDAGTAAANMVYVSLSTMPAGYVSCLAVDPSDGDKVMAVFSNYNVYSLWYTTDAGSTWSKVAGNLEQNVSGTGNGPSMRWVQILNLSDGTAYLAASSTGLYATATLNGTSTIWTRLGDNSIGNSVVDMVKWRSSDGRAIIATHGYGVWSAVINTTGIAGMNPPVMTEQPLGLEVWPNPSVEQATARLTMAHAGHLRMQLFDERGRLVATLMNSAKGEGTFDLALPLGALPAGIYYLSAEAGNSRVVKQIVKL